jgi:2'-5' RNA ligase
LPFNGSTGAESTGTEGTSAGPVSAGSDVPSPALPAAGTVIGVSISVPEPWAAEIQALRAGYGDPLARSVPTHVTLLPPTPLAAAAVPRVHEHLRRVAAGFRPFRMLLHGTGTFRPVTPVVYLRIEEGSRDCRTLEAAVRSGPLARDLDFPYHPHVTVAQAVPEPALDRAHGELRGYHAEFTVRGFSLYRQGADAVWRPLRSYGR